MKKLYRIYIKSHAEAPDYEDQVVAESRDLAVSYFLRRINLFNDDPWSKDAIEEFVDDGEPCGDGSGGKADVGEDQPTEPSPGGLHDPKKAQIHNL